MHLYCFKEKVASSFELIEFAAVSLTMAPRGV